MTYKTISYFEDVSEDQLSSSGECSGRQWVVTVRSLDGQKLSVNYLGGTEGVQKDVDYARVVSGILINALRVHLLQQALYFK